MSREPFADYKNAFTDLEQIKIDYGIKVVKSELSKAAFFMVFFFMIGYWKCCALCILVSVSLRVFVGGLHMKTYFTCFLYSIAVLFIEIVGTAHLSFVPSLAWNISILVSSSIIILLPPIISIQKPLTNPRILRRCKVASIILCVFWSWILLLSQGHLKACGAAVLLLQAVEMLVCILMKKKSNRERRSEHA